MWQRESYTNSVDESAEYIMEYVAMAHNTEIEGLLAGSKSICKKLGGDLNVGDNINGRLTLSLSLYFKTLRAFSES